MSENSKLVTRTLGALYPLILVFGLYIIANGHVSPGGGFQGGALLMAVFICKYLINPQDTVSIHKLKSVEQLMLFFVLLFGLSFLATFAHTAFPILNIPYLIAMNVLIGLKVACGMTIIFYRFILYEVR